MGKVTSAVSILALVIAALLCCVPAVQGSGVLDARTASESAPRLQAVPHTFQPSDIARVPHGKLLLDLVVVLGASLAAASTLIGYHRHYHAAHEILTFREFVLVCMQDQDGKKR